MDISSLILSWKNWKGSEKDGNTDPNIEARKNNGGVRIRSQLLFFMTFKIGWSSQYLKIFNRNIVKVSKCLELTCIFDVLFASYYFAVSFPLFSPSFWLFHMVCGVLVPQPGTEHISPAMEALSLNH